MTPPLRVAVIGAGWAGELHLEAFGRTAGTEVVALCSRTASRAEEVAERFGVSEVCTEPERLYADFNPDIVTVATPPASHRELTLGAIERGCHVLCDKPTALDATTAGALAGAADAAGVRHATGFIWRNDPGILRCRELIGDGTIGEVVELHSRSALGAPVLPMTWMYETAEGGGALMQHGQHVIDRARWLLGDEVDEVSGETHNDVKETVIGPRFHNVMDAFGWAARRARDGSDSLPTTPVTADTGYAFGARFCSGVRATFWEAWHRAGPAPEVVEVHGSHGTLIWSGAAGVSLARPGHPLEPVPVAGSTEAGSGDMKDLREVGHRLWAQLVGAFVDNIRGLDHEPYPDLWDGWHAQRTVDAVRASTDSRRWERC